MLLSPQPIFPFGPLKSPYSGHLGLESFPWKHMLSLSPLTTALQSVTSPENFPGVGKLGPSLCGSLGCGSYPRYIHSLQQTGNLLGIGTVPGLPVGSGLYS